MEQSSISSKSLCSISGNHYDSDNKISSNVNWISVINFLEVIILLLKDRIHKINTTVKIMVSLKETFKRRNTQIKKLTYFCINTQFKS